MCRYTELFPTRLPCRCRQLAQSWVGCCLFWCCELMNSPAEPGQPHARHPQINKHTGRSGEAKPRGNPTTPTFAALPRAAVTGDPCALIPIPAPAATVPQSSLENQTGMPHLKSIQALSPGQAAALNLLFVGVSCELWLQGGAQGCTHRAPLMGTACVMVLKNNASSWGFGGQPCSVRPHCLQKWETKTQCEEFGVPTVPGTWVLKSHGTPGSLLSPSELLEGIGWLFYSPQT